MSKLITTKVSEEMKAAIDRYNKGRGDGPTISDIVRVAISEHLSQSGISISEDGQTLKIGGARDRAGRKKRGV